MTRKTSDSQWRGLDEASIARRGFPATDKVMDTLAAFGAEAEDRENDLCDEADEGQEDDRGDLERDYN